MAAPIYDPRSFEARQVLALESIAASLATLTTRPVDDARDPQPAAPTTCPHCGAPRVCCAAAAR